MHISWLGTTAAKLQVKSLGTDVTIVIDPYKPAQGNFPRSLTADIALYTRGEKDSVTVSGNPFVLSHPGECETKGVLISAPAGHDAGTTLFRIDAEKMSIGHLGLTSKPLTDKQLAVLSDVDILLVPVGGEGGFDAAAAGKAIQSIEPKVVIPMAFKSDTDPKSATVEAFIKEVGVVAEHEDKKLIIKKKDLPQEERRVIVLAKE